MAGRSRTLTLKTQVEVTGADKLNNLGKRIQSVGRNLSVGVTLPLVAAGGALVAMAEEAARADAELTRTFDSMGAAAWTTVDALKANQKELQSLTTFGDEEISHLQSVLLTFGNVTGESFERATEAALDMSALLGQDLQASAVQLGKALNDPIRGVTALRRVGVSFNEQQIEQIRLMTEAGDVAAAQGIILSEVERQFGGAAEALAETAGGQLKQAMNDLGDAGEEFGAIIAPLLRDFAGFLKDVAKWLQELNPETKEWVVRIGALAAALGPLLLVVGSFVRVFSTIPAAGAAIIRVAPLIGAAFHLMLGPIGLVTGALAALAAAFAFDFLGIRSATEGFVNDMALNFGDMGDTVHELADEAGVAFQEMKDTVKREMEETGQSFEQVVRRIKLGTEAMTEAQWDMVEESGNAWAAQRQAISDAMYGPDGAVPIIEGATDDMAEDMGELPGEMADELLANQQRLVDATSELVNFMEQALSPAQEMASLQGFLTSQELAQGLASNNPLVRQKATELREAAEGRLRELNGYQYGAAFAGTFALGISENQWKAQSAAAGMAQAISGIMPQSEPKDPNSPFRGITTWGGKMVTTITDGIYGSLGVAGNASKALAGALAPNLSTSSIGRIGVPGVNAAAPRGGDVHIHLTVMGDLRADERTLPGTLRRAAFASGMGS